MFKPVKSNPSDRANGDNASNSGLVASRRRKLKVSSPPTTLELHGISVHFPFKPYKCQEDYMNQVMKALFRSENALLESPTGTGKTLCLLCSTLAWQRQQARHLQSVPGISSQASAPLAPSQTPQQQQNRVPTIIYASRTHSQLTQVVRELKTTRYRPQHALLGSREQMCVNPKVKTQTASGMDINYDCNRLNKERKCRYKNQLEKFTLTSPESSSSGAQQQPILDMEDLVQLGKQQKICPFYLTRNQVERAELILLPYNYLFDKDARTNTLSEICWENAVVIFDEAHNLESFASDSASFDLSNADLAGCINEVTRAMNYVQAMQHSGGAASHNLNVENLIRLKATFLKLEEYLMNVGVTHGSSGQQQKTPAAASYAGEFMLHFFRQGAGIHHANHEIFIEEVRKVNELIMDLRGTGATRGGERLEHFVQCLKRVFGHSMESRCLAKAAFYRVHISPKVNTGRTISYWCFAPALAMEELSALNVRSILVTSGTLSPLPSYAMELGLPFPNRLENPHIISNEQIHVRVIGKGVTGKIMNSSYQRRQDGEYYSELGNTLVSIARVTPAGMLVFFPSYGVMETCLERWGGPSFNSGFSGQDKKKNFFAPRKKKAAAVQYSFPLTAIAFAHGSASKSPWKRILALKAVVLEPRSSADLPDAMSEFKRFLALPNSKGCILMGVCRGKISEGIDFAHEMSRAVVITGIPFAPSNDAKVKLKREFLDNARASSNIKARTDSGFGGNAKSEKRIDRLSGNDWYTQQAHRAVNQAVGRVIRNRNDYGAILLLDSRFGDKRNQQGLSKWVRPHILNDEGYGVANRSLVQFFKRAKEQAQEREVAEAKRQPVTLAYEEDENESNQLSMAAKHDITKVALIQDDSERPLSPVGGPSGNTASDTKAYVAPNRVIARIDVKEMQESTQKPSTTPVTAQPVTKSFDKVPNHDRVFESAKRKTTSQATAPGGKDSRGGAAQFMKCLTDRFPQAEQSAIKKAIRALKQSGTEKDSTAYLSNTREIMRIICGRESFEKLTGPQDSRTVLLFCRLQPGKHRKTIEETAMSLIYERSTMSKLVTGTLSELDAGRCQTAMVALLHSLWCKDSTVTPSKESLREIQFLLKIIHKAAKGITPIVNNLVRLLPSSYHSITRALSDELVASKTISKLRETDKQNRGEKTLDSSAFEYGRVTTFTPSDDDPPNINPVTPVGTQSVAVQAASQSRAAVVSVAKSASKRPAPKAFKAASNPYAKKFRVPPSAVKFPSARPGTKPVSQGDTKRATVESCLQKLESEPYTKSPTASERRIQSRAPQGLCCPVCSCECKEPFMAECGHMACLSCWLSWLQRSSTCPTCRHTGVTKQSLAQAVFQKGTTSVPTLSQLCKNGSDDELEIR